jgi:hypothetical protein
MRSRQCATLLKCPSELDLLLRVAFGKPQLANISLISITIPTVPGGVERYTNPVQRFLQAGFMQTIL